MDRLDELRCFIAVVETGGFSKAADQRGVTQGMVSRAVATLERRLGAMLFHRSTRRVVPTDEGLSFYERCTPLLEELDDAAAQIAQRASALKGILRVALPATFGRLQIAPLLPSILARHPDLVIDVTTADGRTDLVAQAIDVALRVGGEDEPAEIVKRLARTRVRIVGSRSYFEKHGTPLHPSELVAHNCLVYGRDASSADWPFSGPEGVFRVPVKGSLRSDNVDTIRAAVIGGEGLAAMTEASMVEGLIMPLSKTVLDDFVPWTFDVKAVWVKRRFVPAKVRMFVDFLSEHLPHAPGITPLN
jgi:DNA-binding transcriptional LysR family regulator